MPYQIERLKKTNHCRIDDGTWGADIFNAHNVGCNAVSWAPATLPGSLITPTPTPGAPASVKRFASAGCDNLVKIWGFRYVSQSYALGGRSLRFETGKTTKPGSKRKYSRDTLTGSATLPGHLTLVFPDHTSLPHPRYAPLLSPCFVIQLTLFIGPLSYHLVKTNA